MIEDFGLKPPNVVLYKGPDITSIFSMILWGIKITLISIIKKKSIFKSDNNGIVLVHGDTFSTLLGAIMGRIAGLKVGHVESGLRSFNFFHPFPEEVIRMITFRLSHILFCPGAWSVKNVTKLNKEIVNTYTNTLVDTIHSTSAKAMNVNHVPSHKFVVVSIHRYENIFKKEVLAKIADNIEYISSVHKIVFILHQPTYKQLKYYGLYEKLSLNENISLRNRYKHSDFVMLLKNCEFVVTDGGSLQEETYFMGVPCLLIRKVTERQEGIGENVLVSNYNNELIKRFCVSYPLYRRKKYEMKNSPSEIIVNKLMNYV